jgi:hypothetical protein
MFMNGNWAPNAVVTLLIAFRLVPSAALLVSRLGTNRRRVDRDAKWTSHALRSTGHGLE